MDWTGLSSRLPASDAEAMMRQSSFTDINFPLSPSYSNFLLDQPELPVSAACELLSSSDLSSSDSPPSWATATSPPSPAPSTSSLSSTAWSSFSSDHSSSHPITPYPTLTPAPPPPSAFTGSPNNSSKTLKRPNSDCTPTNATTQAPTVKQARSKRESGSTLTVQQRAELKRRKHREIDALRIQREKQALTHLTQLTSNQRQQQQHTPHDTEAEVEADEGSEGKRDKVRVLEDSARKIEELQRLVARLTDTCAAQQSTNRQLVHQLYTAIQPPHTTTHNPHSSHSSHALSLVHPSAVRRLDATVGSASLHASWFVGSSASICVIRCSTGCVLDVNERLLRDSGWQRDHIVGRLMCPPYSYITAPQTYGEQAYRALSAQRTLVRGADGVLVPASTQTQYQRSKQLIRELYDGVRQSIECVFRNQLLDGRVYEVNNTLWTNSWVDEPDSVSGGSGSGARRRPDIMFMISSYADALCVDEA